MKKLLLIATCLIFVISNVKGQGFTLTPKWIESVNVGGFTPVGTLARCMAYYGDTLYFGDRATTTNKMRLYSAETGEFARAFVMPTVTSVNGNNCIRTDVAGNIILSNLTTDARTTPFHVWRMANANAEPTLIINFTDPTAPKALRIDFSHVYGNVFGDGYIIAAIVGTGLQDQDKTVLKWNINGGIVSSTPERIILQDYYPASSTSNGATPHVFPVDATSFFFDGAGSYPTLYGTNGSLLDGFANAGSVTKPAAVANGVATVQLGTKHFLICGANSTINSFNLYQMGEGGTFSGMTLLSTFPEGGLSTSGNASNVVLPVVNKVSETQADIYIYAPERGYAKYELHTGPFSALSEIKNDDNYIITQNGIIHLTEKSNVEAYTISGQKIISKRDVFHVDVPTISGVYVINISNHNGTSTTKKILVK
ncbi:MAG: T9SS type A sorting domain-containing protein [Paludibacter sp.]|nr:T9SS type A sorting domain-containing protein [Paludibacter sp.]